MTSLHICPLSVLGSLIFSLAFHISILGNAQKLPGRLALVALHEQGFGQGGSGLPSSLSQM